MSDVQQAFLGVFGLLVALGALAVIVVTAFDILARVDIGWAKLGWLGLVMMLPFGGALAYWLFRPKTFNPWLERRQETAVYVRVASPEWHGGEPQPIPSAAEPPEERKLAA